MAQPELSDLLRFRSDLMQARYSGVRRLRDQNGEEVEYRSDTELARALASLEQTIAAAQSRPVSSIRFSTSKGL
jgi:hypothetical protein